MPTSEQIAPHIPYLRRFARALSGSQESGDGFVEATLRAIVASDHILRGDVSVRVALYRAFLEIWNSAPINRRAHTAADAAPRLSRVTPQPRQAFLLTSVEAFRLEEAAAVMAVSTAECRALVEAAGHEIAEQIATDVLIIEDEPIIALDLEALVEDLGHRVIGSARTYSEAIKAIGESLPGLILADIQLADGTSGLDAVNDILSAISVPVVFITAYPERLLTGAKPEPAFLITKPFQPSHVQAIVSQALFFDRNASRTRLIA